MAVENPLEQMYLRFIATIDDPQFKEQIDKFYCAVLNPLTQEEIISKIIPKDTNEIQQDVNGLFGRAKATLYSDGFITLGRRNGKIRRKTIEEIRKSRGIESNIGVENNAASQDTQPESPESMDIILVEAKKESELVPSLKDWLIEQDWFTHIYSAAETSLMGANYNPDILGVALPDYDNLPSYEIEVIAIEVKRGVKEFLEDKLLAEVTTYQNFAHYVYAAYYKPWYAFFQPPDYDEHDRILQLQRYGIGVFWVTGIRSNAKEKKYRCVMIQNANAGKPMLDKLTGLIRTYKNRLVDENGNSLPDLKDLAWNYYATSGIKIAK
ncbi:MAG: hypothetical protein HQM09_17625 [Candidatus Riflebacteria bacterium]|nr:hypothetical protein [Candidatus Riflebacteria bacterium]